MVLTIQEHFGAHRGARLFSRDMESTRTMADHGATLAEMRQQMQEEMQVEMQRQLEEIRHKSEEEINALRAENQRIRRQIKRIARRTEVSREKEEQEETSDQEELRAQTNPNHIGRRVGTPRHHPFVDGIMAANLPAR